MESLERAANKRIREIRAQANVEHRTLSETEVAQIKKIVETVNRSREEIATVIEAVPEIKSEILRKARDRGTPLTPKEHDVLKAIYALLGGEKVAQKP
jgi:predicted RNase H-like nuclease